MMKTIIECDAKIDECRRRLKKAIKMAQELTK